MLVFVVVLNLQCKYFHHPVTDISHIVLSYQIMLCGREVCSSYGHGKMKLNKGACKVDKFTSLCSD